MTEAIPSYDAAAAWAAIEAQHAARKRLAEEVRPINKTALFDALAMTGITTVIVTFDGSGDSGQIESVDAHNGEQPVDLPSGIITIRDVLWDGSAVETLELPVAEALERLAYAFLEETHDGWEINEGAYGEFTFDVAERAIRLDYNERVESSEYSGHEW